MAVARWVPGAKSGATKRNVVVAIVYLAFLPLVPFVLATTLGYHVWQNTDGLAAHLSMLPGVSEAGGAKSGVVVGVGILALSLALFGTLVVEHPYS